MFAKAEKSLFNVVFVGPFAPRMFHPLWFQSVGLVGKNEADAATGRDAFVITDQFTAFTVGFFDIQVTNERMTFATTREDQLQPLIDIACGTMKTLDKSPIQHLGCNWIAHFSLPSVDKWHAAGDFLASKKFWNSVWTKHVGLMKLDLKLEREDKEEGSVNLSVQPSGLIPNGVFFSFNDHYDFSQKENFDVGQASAFLEAGWQPSIARAREVADALYREVLNG